MPSPLRHITENRISKEAYSEYSDDICHYNLNNLRLISFVGMLCGLTLFIASLPPFNLLDLTYGYLAVTLVCAVPLLLSYTLLVKKESLVFPVYYAMIFLALCVGIVMGTYLGLDTNATTFVMLILTLPLFIIDRPWRVNLLFGAMCLVFCIVDYAVKPSHFSHLDVSNCIVFYLVSLVVSRQAIKAKMADIIIKRELKQQRDIDMLTQLNNRGAFERIVAKYIHESNKNAIMIIMDIDNFKSVNDLMGHSYGDMVLQLVGEYLKATFRSSDIVSRLGGDEFVAFLPSVGDVQIITEKLQNLIQRIESIQIESDSPCKISASIGLAQYPDDGCSFESLYRQADAALYYAKRNGKGQFAVYDPDIMDQKTFS